MLHPNDLATNPADRERLAYLLKDLRQAGLEARGIRLLDMGAGTGVMSAAALLEYPDAQATLVDVIDDVRFDSHLLGNVRGRYEFVPWKHVASLPKRSYDLVLSTDVLEHIADWQKSFANLAEYVKPGGSSISRRPAATPLRTSQSMAYGGRWFCPGSSATIPPHTYAMG
jgi:2-polyprenyl-3-methyl-5-hydroxy-6-metoxy-1,4-benzoquinol methylase